MLYHNDKKILLELSRRDSKLSWLDRKDFSMNEKTFWNRIKYLEEGGYINVIRHSGVKNLYSLTEQGSNEVKEIVNLDLLKIFALTNFKK